MPAQFISDCVHISNLSLSVLVKLEIHYMLNLK